MREIEELNKAWKEAYSIENMERHGVQEQNMKYIGTIRRGNKVFLLYRDSSGGYWYRKQMHTEEGDLNEFEFIFGKKEKKRYKSWTKK